MKQTTKGGTALSRPVITYTPTRGRAEPIRLILEELGIKYDEHHVRSLDEWLALKPRLPFLQVPTYQDGDLVIVQSHAIYRHLARTHDLYGHSETERIACDIVEEAIAEAQDQIWWFLNGLFPEKDPARFAQEGMSTTLGCLQKFFQRNTLEAQFWSGKSITFVDLLAFAYLDEVRAIFPDTLSKFGALLEFRNRIAKRPRIAEYLRSDRRPAAILFGRDGRPLIDPQSNAPAPSPFWTPAG
ncbi:MAG: glutathione S-transferase family protein [Candidatus Binataceae bacterium]